MTKERDYTITTWADGFGAWHARVPTSPTVAATLATANAY